MSPVFLRSYHMSFNNMSLMEYSAALASGAAAPGGGGAAAVAAALGASLASMVGNLSIGKKKFAEYENDIRGIIERAEKLRLRLLELSDADAQAFLPLSRAYSLPRDMPGRDDIMEECLERAASVPMDILRCAGQALELHGQIRYKSSALAVSDVACGAAFLKAAVLSAAVNVRVNTRLMKNRVRAGEIDRMADELTGKYTEIADRLFAGVWEELT